MERKKIIKILLFAIIIGLFVDIISFIGSDSIKLKRNEIGEGSTEVDVSLNAKDTLKNYKYKINIQEKNLTKKEKKAIFKKAKKEIDSGFCSDKEDKNHVTKTVNLPEKLVDGKIQAEWTFDRYDVINPNGTLIYNKISKKGDIVTAKVELTCGSNQEEYSFAFVVYPRKLSKKEELIQKVNKYFVDEQKDSKSESVKLPSKIGNTKLKWKKPINFYALKILGFSVVVIFLLRLKDLEDSNNKKKEHELNLRLDYPKIVSKLSILLGSGMSVSQAWNKIAVKYLEEKENNGKIRPGYEELLKANREIKDGESEKVAYQKFGERAGIPEYRKFSRILIQNMQKGSRGLSQTLENEAIASFEARKNLARKLGEEAGTKLLLPMMIMMGIVMAVVIAPAIFTFQI